MNRNVAVVYRETEALKTYKDCVVAQEQRLSRNVIARYMAFLKVHDHAPDTRVATSWGEAEDGKVVETDARSEMSCCFPARAGCC